MNIARGFVSLFLLTGWASIQADEPVARPTVTIRAIRPDRQLAAIIDLFQGSRASDPAAALAAWKRASPEPKQLGKLGDALIALMNPLMIREVASLDSAEVAFSPVPNSDRWDWWVRFPHDDGTLAALGPTADLSGGGVEPPIGPNRVDRFPGSNLVLMARGPDTVCAANNRTQLEAALAASQVPASAPPIESGWVVRIDPANRSNWTTLAGRRWAAAAEMTHCRAITGQIQLNRATLLAAIIGHFNEDTPSIGPIDPDWFAGIPARGPFAAFGMRVDPRAAAWGRLFALLDRIERTDPERANVVSSRVRLALAGRAVGVRLETDVWPHLIGLAGWAGLADGIPNRGAILLHLDADVPAQALLAGVSGLRRLDGADEVVEPRPIAGQSLRLVRRRNIVVVAWGTDGWTATRAALDHSEQSAKSWLSTSRTGTLPVRVGAIWLDQLPFFPPGGPLAASLALSPPLRWSGTNEGDRTTDEFWITGLDKTIREFLDRLPLNPPPNP